MSHWIIRLHVPWFSTWGASAVVKVNTPQWTVGLSHFLKCWKQLWLQLILKGFAHWAACAPSRLLSWIKRYPVYSEGKVVGYSLPGLYQNLRERDLSLNIISLYMHVIICTQIINNSLREILFNAIQISQVFSNFPSFATWLWFGQYPYSW